MMFLSVNLDVNVFAVGRHSFLIAGGNLPARKQLPTEAVRLALTPVTRKGRINRRRAATLEQP
jgi:hypothetical protein